MVKSVFIIRKICPFCESKKISQIFKKNLDDIDIVNYLKKHLNKNFPLKILEKKKFVIMECQNCTGLFQKNILNNKYNKKFYDKYVPHDEAFEKKQNNKSYFDKIYRYEISLIKNYFKKEKNIKVLEIGAGWGFWSINALKNNMDISAVELSQVRRNFLRKKNVKVYNSINSLKGKFHFIFSDQTFEHLSHPLRVLKKISKSLKKNGIIFLKVPPGVYIKKKLNSKYRVGDDEIIPLEHINVFNVNVNRHIAKKLNLKYIYPKNCYSFLSFDFIKKIFSDFHENYSSKTIIFRK